RCLDPALVSALARAQSHGNAVWQDARARNDFSTFAPALQELILLRREQASQLAAAEPVQRSPWEILAQPFEPDVNKARLEELFAPLKLELPALLDQVRVSSSPLPEDIDLPEALQEQLCAELLDAWGYDPVRCQRSRSAHPFSCTVGPQDFRITTRVVPGQPLSAFLATAHEWGHSLYEQGLPRTDDHYFPWPLGEATSMGVHESQSLFWDLRPTTDALGCLQDIHWAEGLFGYFPSYALGHLISAQISESLEQELGPIQALIHSGGEAELQAWLGRTVWPLGRSVNAEALVQTVSGQPLSARPFLSYLRAKVEELTASR
ncbi:MAG: hypothetical protein EBR33_10350, partial [Synechococcaceae bacterium WB4_1_0192]|nr:hypothetical protein [Synechococcaceae bacterium WB4_1_0192]